jgi:hypothetical protein
MFWLSVSSVLAHVILEAAGLGMRAACVLMYILCVFIHKSRGQADTARMRTGSASVMWQGTCMRGWLEFGVSEVTDFEEGGWRRLLRKGTGEH